MTAKTAGVLGAMTLLAGASAAQAAPTIQPDLATVMNPTSYADLLQPIPNATDLLKASDAQERLLPLARDGDATMEEAQYYHHHHHHHHFYHHHHHHGYFRGPFFHHHHHGYYRHFYHHHHHHHHHFFQEGY